MPVRCGAPGSTKKRYCMCSGRLNWIPIPGMLCHIGYSEIYVEMGRYDEAIASLKKAQSHGGNAVGISADVAGVYARIGKQKEARRMLEELKATSDPARFSNLELAHAYTALGDKDEAFKVLFRLVERSEERRVGKECRTWRAWKLKRKKTYGKTG